MSKPKEKEEQGGRRLRNLSGLSGLNDLSALQNASQEDKVLLLSPEDIVVKPQVRRRFINIEELAESFQVDGQQQPITVSPKNKDTGKYELQKGERRYRAALLIPGFKLKAIVDSKTREDAEKHASQLIENIQRENLLPHEVGRALLVIREGMLARGEKATGRELAKKVGKKEPYVSQHLALAEIPDDLAQLIDDGITSDSDIIHGLKQISELSPALYADLMKQARDQESGGLSRADVRNSLKVARGQLPSATNKGAGEGAGSVGHNGQQQINTAGQAHVPPAGGANQKPAGGDGQGGAENISHAETLPNGTAGAAGAGAGNQAGTPPPQTPNPGNGAALPKSQKKLGKAETKSIDPRAMVIGVRVAMEKKVLSGYLLLDRIVGDASKCWVRVMDGGKEVEKLVAGEAVEMVSFAELATGD